jgi:hypothetical protein
MQYMLVCDLFLKAGRRQELRDARGFAQKSMQLNLLILNEPDKTDFQFKLRLMHLGIMVEKDEMA